MKKTLAIVDYMMGNLNSVMKKPKGIILVNLRTY